MVQFIYTVKLGVKMDRNKRIAISILSLIGLALSIELCVVYYNSNFVQNAAPSICAISDTIDCDGVAKTAYSQSLGVPLSLWGVCLYLFTLFMTWIDKIQKFDFTGLLKVFKNQTSYIFSLMLLSFVMSMGLATISIFKINSICLFCFMTYLVDLIIALVAKDWKQNLLFEIKTSIADFIEALKVRRQAFYFFLVVVLAAAILSYTATTNVLAPQLKIQKMLKQMINSLKLEQADGNTIGPKNADLVINEYIDFNCGGCFIAHIYLHRIVEEFENVKVVQHNLPLEKVCNHNMQYEGHKGSCMKTSYALAAKKQNKYWEMADILFLQQPETEKEVIEKARLADFDIRKLKDDVNSEEIKTEIKDSIAEADSKDIQGTPTIYIGMKRIMGVGSYEEFKKTVIENGGREKPNHN